MLQSCYTSSSAAESNGVQLSARAKAQASVILLQLLRSMLFNLVQCWARADTLASVISLQSLRFMPLIRGQCCARATMLASVICLQSLRLILLSWEHPPERFSINTSVTFRSLPRRTGARLRLTPRRGNTMISTHVVFLMTILLARIPLLMSHCNDEIECLYLSMAVESIARKHLSQINLRCASATAISRYPISRISSQLSTR